MKKKREYLGHENYQAIQYSGYALVALHRVLSRISDRLDYSDIELKMLMIDVHQEAMTVANYEFTYVMDAAESIEKQIYKGYERQLILDSI